MWILKCSHRTCISAVILASKWRNQNIEEARAGTHMHLYEDKTKKEKQEQAHVKTEWKHANYCIQQNDGT